MEKVTIDHIIKLGFSGPYPNGEYYLFDKNYKRTVIVSGKVRIDDENWLWVKRKTLKEFYIIMCVYPGAENEKWQGSYNELRAMWCNDKNLFDSGFIDFTTIEELEELIKKSKDLKINEKPFYKVK